MKKLLFLLCVILPFSAISETIYVSDTVGGTWDADTVIISSDLYIPPGETLLINPGVNVLSAGAYRIVCRGIVQAQGSEENPINFSLQDTSQFNDPDSVTGGWLGFYFDNAQIPGENVLFDYCSFSYAKMHLLNFTQTYEPGSITIQNCNFNNNGMVTNRALIHNFSTSDMLFQNNRITHNRDFPFSNAYCGIFYHSVLGDQTILDNYAAYNEGSIFLAKNCLFKARNNVLIKNLGLCFKMHQLCTAYLEHNVMADNGLLEHGSSPIQVYNGSITAVSNFIRNNESKMGGAIYLYESCPNIFINNIIVNNRAKWGGAIYAYDSHLINFYNNTIYNNFAARTAGMFYCFRNGFISFINNIMYSNECAVDSNPIEISQTYTENFTVKYNNIENGIHSFGFFENTREIFHFNGIYEDNIDYPPEFVNENIFNYRLVPFSPCINMGTPDTTGLGIGQTDYYVNQRIYDGATGRVDIGAAEYQAEPEITACPEFSLPIGPNPSGSELAITCTTPGAEIYYTTDGSLPDNTSIPYTQPISLNGFMEIKAMAYSPDNAQSVIKAGDFITGTSVSGIQQGEWILADSPYILDGIVEVPPGDVLTIQPGVTVIGYKSSKLLVSGKIHAIGDEELAIEFSGSDNTFAWQGIELDGNDESGENSIFSYCVIEGVSMNSEGALQILGCPDTDVLNCTIRDNYCSGIKVESDNTEIINCDISGNRGFNGGGIYLKGSNNLVEFSNIHNNFATNFGAGIYFRGGNVIIRSNKIVGNDGNICYGGGIYIFSNDGTAEIANNLIAGNTAFSGGGIMKAGNFAPLVYNNTIANNNGNNGGGLFMFGQGQFVNNIIYGNTALLAGNQIFITRADPGMEMRYCNVEGGYNDIEGNDFTELLYEDNIDNEPSFLCNDHNYYALRSDSPCIDAGDPDTPSEILPAHDLMGHQRFYNSRIDIGAYEHDGTEGIEGNEMLMNKLVTKLYNNSPNPFNPTTAISFDLAHRGAVSLYIYNIRGQLVNTLIDNEIKDPGHHTLVWNGKNNSNINVGSGVYFYTLRTGDAEQVCKMVLMK